MVSVSLGLGGMQFVLLDLVEQCLVADLKQGRGFLPMPVGLLQSMRYGCRFSLLFHGTSQELQTADIRLRRSGFPRSPLTG